MQEIDVSGFRGVRKGELRGLTGVTVLVGSAGSGKTAALEALDEAHLANAPEDDLRRCWGTTTLESLCGADLEFNYYMTKRYPVREKEAICLLHRCPGMSGFSGVHVLPEKPGGHTWYTYATFEGGQKTEPPDLGQGRFRLVMMAYAYAAVPPEGGTVLLDCPEVYQGPSGLRTIAELVAHTVCAWGVQTILATQSLELIDLLIWELSEREKIDVLSSFRLRLTDEGELRSTRLKGDHVRLSREALLTDLRE